MTHILVKGDPNDIDVPIGCQRFCLTFRQGSDFPQISDMPNQTAWQRSSPTAHTTPRKVPTTPYYSSPKSGHVTLVEHIQWAIDETDKTVGVLSLWVASRHNQCSSRGRSDVTLCIIVFRSIACQLTCGSIVIYLSLNLSI